MTTFISSEALRYINHKKSDIYFQCHAKNVIFSYINQLTAITLPTNRRMGISNYRVSSLLKKYRLYVGMVQHFYLSPPIIQAKFNEHAFRRIKGGISIIQKKVFVILILS